MKVLIVVENLHEIVHANYFSLVGSFTAAFENDPDYEMIVRCISPADIWSPQQLSSVLLETDFDIAVVSPLWHVYVELSVAKKIGKKLFIYLTDTHTKPFTSNIHTNFRTFISSKPKCGHTFVYTCKQYAEYCNIIALDYGHGEMYTNIYCMHPTFSSKFFYSIPEEEKTINLGFIGSVNTAEREFFIKNISNKFPLNKFGNKVKLSWKEFADVYRKTKMTFAFNEIYNGLPHRKWKIYEAAACGSFVFATRSEVFKVKNYEIFSEGVHYAAIDKSNYSDVIKYYMNNPEKRLQISRQLHNHYLENFSDKQFWHNIFKYAKDK